MAYQMIHMEIVYRLLQILPGIMHPAEFMVGSVAPDSVHMRSDFGIAMKVKSHLFDGCGPWGDTQDYVRWLSNMEAFWRANGTYAKGQEKSYLAGIYVHCLTDYCNDLYIWRKLQRQYAPPMETEEFRTDFYHEARGIDQWLFQNSPHTKEIVRLFRAGSCMTVLDLIDKKDVEKQKEYMLGVQYPGEVPNLCGYKYLSAEFLETFLNKTVEYIASVVAQLVNEKR